jgi:hypothetical protein
LLAPIYSASRRRVLPRGNEVRADEGESFVDRSHGKFLSVSCGACGILHRPEDDLEFDPICAACTAAAFEKECRIFGRSDELDDERPPV